MKETQMILPDRVFHYNCDEFHDVGWGCVYRCAQNLFQVLGLHPPSITDIQEVAQIDPGSRGRALWIEPVDVIKGYYELGGSAALTPVLLGLRPDPARMLRTCASDFDRIYDSDSGFHAEVLGCLAREHPVLVDDATFSYLIVGIETGGEVEETTFWILDPHMRVPGTQLVKKRASDLYSSMLMAIVWV